MNKKPKGLWMFKPGRDKPQKDIQWKWKGTFLPDVATHLLMMLEEGSVQINLKRVGHLRERAPRCGRTYVLLIEWKSTENPNKLPVGPLNITGSSSRFRHTPMVTHRRAHTHLNTHISLVCLETEAEMFQHACITLLCQCVCVCVLRNDWQLAVLVLSSELLFPFDRKKQQLIAFLSSEFSAGGEFKNILQKL